MKIFFICGATIGFIGTLLGTTIGILLAKNIQNIKIWYKTSLKNNKINIVKVNKNITNCFSYKNHLSNQKL